jgi:hypothetical protein
MVVESRVIVTVVCALLVLASVPAGSGTPAQVQSNVDRPGPTVTTLAETGHQSTTDASARLESTDLTTVLDGELTRSDGTAVAGWKVLAGTESGATSTRTESNGSYSLSVEQNRSYTVWYQQYNSSKSAAENFPNDGVVDLYALETVQVGTGPVSLPAETLPAGHSINVSVVDSSGAPLSNVHVRLYHIRGETAAPVEASTNGDGVVVLDGTNQPGVELNGTVGIEVFGPSGYETERRTVTVNRSQNYTVTLEAQPRISGTVRNETGQGLSDVRVFFDRPETAEGGTNVTTEQGHYAVDLPGTGTFVVDLTQEDLPGESFPNDGVPGLYARGSVEINKTNTSANFTLPAGNDVNFTVVDENGSALSDVRVHVGHEAGDEGAYISGTTDSAGRFVPRGATDPGIELNGSVGVYVEAPAGYADAGRELTVTGPQTVRIQLQRAVPSTGRVLEPDGTPADGDRVTLEPLQGRMDNTTWTNATGRYRGQIGIDGESGVAFVQTADVGSYEPTFPSDGVPDVHALGLVNASSPDLGTVSLPDPANLTVTVRYQNGTRAAGVPLDIVHDPPRRDDLEAHGRTYTNASGMATVEVVGVTDVFVDDVAGVAEGGTELDVTEDRRVNLTLQSAATVTGELEYANGTAPDGYHVSLWGDEESYGERLDADGRFELSAATNRTYRFGFEQTDWDGPREDFPRDGAPDVHAFGTVSVGTGPVALGETRLPQANVLNVTVVDESGAPIAGVPIDVEHRNDGASAWIHGRTTSDGRLVLNGAETPGVEANGTLRVHFRPQEAGLPYQPTTQGGELNSSRNVTVTLESTNRLSGRWVGPDGSPLANVSVTAFNFSTGTFDTTRTNETGAYALQLPEGIYTVNAVPLETGDGVADAWAVRNVTVDGSTALGTHTVPRGYNVTVSAVDRSDGSTADAYIAVIGGNERWRYEYASGRDLDPPTVGNREWFGVASRDLSNGTHRVVVYDAWTHDVLRATNLTVDGTDRQVEIPVDRFNGTTFSDGPGVTIARDLPAPTSSQSLQDLLDSELNVRLFVLNATAETNLTVREQLPTGYELAGNVSEAVGVDGSGAFTNRSYDPTAGVIRGRIVGQVSELRYRLVARTTGRESISFDGTYGERRSVRGESTLRTASDTGDTATVSLDPPLAEPGANDTVTLDVRLDSAGSAVYATETQVSFDPARLSVRNVSVGPFLGQNNTTVVTVKNSVDSANGTATTVLTRAETTAGTTGTGALLHVTFAVESETNATQANVTLSRATLSRANQSAIPVTRENGTVSLADGPDVTPIARTPVNHVGSPLKLLFNATTNDSTLDRVRLRGPAGRTLTETTLNGTNATVWLNQTLSNATWNETRGEYERLPFSMIVTDEAGGRTTFDFRVAVRIAGDTTGDGRVDIFDAVAVGRAYGSDLTEDRYRNNADLNNDGTVDILDAVLIGNNWRTTAGPPE